MAAELGDGAVPESGVAWRCLLRLPQAVMLLAGDGRTIRWFNDAAQRLFALEGPVGAAASALTLDDVLKAQQGQSPLPLPDELRVRPEGEVLWTRLDQGQPSTWVLTWRRLDEGLVLTAQDQAPWIDRERQRRDDRSAHREQLIREVHHRLKNSLQGVSGLLLRLGDAHPEVREGVGAAVSQIRILAEVHDLQLRGGMQPRPGDLLQAVARAVAGVDGPRIEILMRPGSSTGGASDDGPGALRGLLWAHLEQQGPTVPPDAGWRLSEADAPSLGLCLGELLQALMSRAKASPDPSVVNAEVTDDPHGVWLTLRAGGRWPEGWDPERLAPGLQGLPLAKALLPRRGAVLELVQEDTKVGARLRLAPPCVFAPDPAGPQSGW